MRHPFYKDILVSEDKNLYEFVSYGKKGEIVKIVEFSEIHGYYNLALGDKLQDGSYNFERVSDNGDLPLIITTVINIVLRYTRYFPEKTISIYGYDRTRTLLYERAIRNNYKDLSAIFYIWGIRKDMVKEIFNPATSYSGFLVKRK